MRRTLMPFAAAALSLVACSPPADAPAPAAAARIVDLTHAFDKE